MGRDSHLGVVKIGKAKDSFRAGRHFSGIGIRGKRSPYLLTHDEPDGTVRDEEGVPNPSFQLTRPTEP
jgi:hypothetical protein